MVNEKDIKKGNVSNKVRHENRKFVWVCVYVSMCLCVCECLCVNVCLCV
jgi:hypothetical protein